jgi:hypothetical protein
LYNFYYRRGFRLINLQEIKESTEPWDLIIFQNTIDKQVHKAIKYLRSNWFGGIQKIFILVSNNATKIIDKS